MKDILDIFLYFSKFVTADVRKKQISKGSRSAYEGYASFVEKLLNVSEIDAVVEIKDFFYSINEKFLADRIRNATGILLFVEYGNINFEKIDSVDKSEIVLAVSVASEFTSANSDMIEEAILMQKCLDLLKSMVEKMYEDYDCLENCSENEIIVYPVEFYPIIPSEFYNHGGWTAMFKRRYRDDTE